MNRTGIVTMLRTLCLAAMFMPAISVAAPVQIEACDVDDPPAICKQARKACTKALADANVRKSFAAKPYIKNCMVDAVSAGTISDALLNKHRTLYINAAHAHADRPARPH